MRKLSVLFKKDFRVYANVVGYMRLYLKHRRGRAVTNGVCVAHKTQIGQIVRVDDYLVRDHACTRCGSNSQVINDVARGHV